MNLEDSHLRGMSPFVSAGVLRPYLVELLELFGIEADLTKVEFVDLVEELMERWVTKGSERWLEPAVDLDTPEKLERFWELVKRLPLYARLLPRLSNYQYVLVTGGTLKPQDRKNAFVVTLARVFGIEFDRIVCLGGDRPADAKLDDPALLTQTLPGGLSPRPDYLGAIPYATEAEMVKALWTRSDLGDPVATIPVDFLVAERTTGHRAHTGDTLVQWHERYQPEPGRVLVISISPHGPFQYWDAMYRLADYGFQIDIAAPSAELGPQTLSYFTGAIARWLRSYGRAMGMLTFE